LPDGWSLESLKVFGRKNNRLIVIVNHRETGLARKPAVMEEIWSKVRLGSVFGKQLVSARSGARRRLSGESDPKLTGTPGGPVGVAGSADRLARHRSRQTRGNAISRYYDTANGRIKKKTLILAVKTVHYQRSAFSIFSERKRENIFEIKVAIRWKKS